MRDSPVRAMEKPRLNRAATVQRPWTSGELALLRQLATGGAEVAAAILGRSVASVKTIAYRYDISLRASGERRGARRGTESPNAAGVAGGRVGALARAVRDGSIELEFLEELVHAGVMAPLCPTCGMRPQDPTRRTGLCTVCHIDRLTDAHNLAMQTAAARRRLDAARASKYRRRRREEAS